MSDQSLTLDQEFDLDLSQQRYMAKMLALGVRNGLEDLHCDGAFSDSEAPRLNRAVRNRIFEVLAAVAIGYSQDEEGKAATAFDWLFTSYPTSEDGDIYFGIAPFAVERAIEEFAKETTTPTAMPDRMTEVGRKALIETADMFRRFGRDGEADEEASFGVRWMDMSLPSYWKEPVPGADLLDALGI
jgi:hypothetical protein